jgi:anti-sigma B factor antagonist
MSKLETNYPVHHNSEEEATLELSGDLTSRYAELIEADFLTLSRSGVTRVILDFSKVRYINSTGIAVLIRLINLSRTKFIELSAVGLSQHYHEIFKITKIGDYIKVLS